MKKYFWLFALIAGFIGFLVIWFFLPHQSEIENPLEVFFKIAVFLCLCLGIAFFPNTMSGGYILLLAPLAAFVGYFLPRIGYFGFWGEAQTQPGDFYTHLYLLTYPAIMMTVCFALRMGGGSPGEVLKTAINGTLIIFSGFLDVMFFVINPVDFPERLSNAHHIQIIIGKYPTFTGGIFFMLAHIPIIIGIYFIPLDKWGKKLGLLD